MSEKEESYETRSGTGFVFAFFLGIIGLIIGLLLYPAGTVMRKTFLKAWLITTAVQVFIMLFGVLFIAFRFPGFFIIF